jgi:phenol 2-monooxygenase
MDSYNLAWKLAYAVHGLTPDLSSNVPFDLLDTYHIERHTIAQQLIEFDRTFSSMFSGKINRGNKDRGDDCKETSVGELSHEQFLEAFSTGNGFTSGCGIEYPESTIVDKKDSHFANHLLHQKDYLSGILRPGRRLNNVRLRRYADGRPRDIHDGIDSLLSSKNDYSSY